MRVLDQFSGPNGPTWSVEFKDLDEELRFLRKLIVKFRGNPVIRDLAIKIINDTGVESRDKKLQALAIANWVKENIYYVHELPERFQFPDETLRSKAGDCDDFSTLIGSMLESIGIPSFLVAMNINGKWSHIFCSARIDNGLLPLGSTNRFGVEINPIKFAYEKGKTVMVKVV
jgi:hypothetical protein